MRKKENIKFSLNNNRIYKPSQIRQVLDKAVSSKHLKGSNKGIQYYNVPAAFDIESTSFYVDDNNNAIDYKTKIKREKIIKGYETDKRCIMYIWQFGINGYIIVGRTWQEFKIMITEIADHLGLNEKKRLIIYVHNLSYEFQFICKLFNWWFKEKDQKTAVFASEQRKVIYAITDTFVEFRCSLFLSGYNLDNLGKNLLKYKVKKLKGNLDYSLLRHSRTTLTKAELDYCINDIKVVMAYIQEEIERYKYIGNIPLTKTGKVRKHCREFVFRLPNNKRLQNLNYKSLIKDLTINGMDEFKQLQRGFMGGFTHANAQYVGDLLQGVSSFDFTSSYPFVMVSEQFPMSKAVYVNADEMTDKEYDLFIDSYDKYLSVFDITFTKLERLNSFETPLSSSKCYLQDGVIENNGRVAYANKVMTTLTNVDYEIMKKFYTWEDEIISNLRVYKKGYLPTALVTCILDLYENKTILKGVKGQEVNYMQSKEMINSVYGMSVTNPLRDENLYIDNEWTTKENDLDESLELLYKYNTSKNRFLYYPWGIFVTAYARRNLFTGIAEFKDDYIYSDTDSIKVLNYENHKEYFEKYNQEVANKLKKACEHHNIDFEKTQPKTKEGKLKPLGVWDYEGTYNYFKTLGAKRYMYSKDDDISIVVAGVPPKAGAEFLKESGKGDILKSFENFEIGLTIPPDETDKNFSTYLDFEQVGIMVDYQGNEYNYQELSSLHLEPTEYSLSMSQLFIDYLLGVTTGVN